MAIDNALSALDVAKLLGVSKNTVYEMVRRGELKSYRVGRKMRFTKEDVDSYIARSHGAKRIKYRRSKASRYTADCLTASRIVSLS